ncbi:MAG: hypothetical protein QOH40_2085 [Arthrobacter pascens]|nr:hypothetical protein [Arthrobacter pascens]
MLAFSADDLHSCARAAVESGAAAALVGAGLDGVEADVEATGEVDGGSDVAEAPGLTLLLASAGPVVCSGLDWLDGWLGPQAVSKSASAAAAVVPASPVGIR